MSFATLKSILQLCHDHGCTLAFAKASPGQLRATLTFESELMKTQIINFDFWLLNDVDEARRDVVVREQISEAIYKARYGK